MIKHVTIQSVFKCLPSLYPMMSILLSGVIYGFGQAWNGVPPFDFLLYKTSSKIVSGATSERFFVVKLGIEDECSIANL